MKVKNQYLKILEYLHLSFNKWPSLYSINSRYLSFFETTIMGKTADLAMVQKTIVDTLHKESKLQRASLKGVECKIAQLTEGKRMGRKMCTSNRDDRKLENPVKQSRFKHLGELHKEWTKAGVSASRVTTLRRIQEKGYQATSETETTSEASYLG